MYLTRFLFTTIALPLRAAVFAWPASMRWVSMRYLSLDFAAVVVAFLIAGICRMVYFGNSTPLFVVAIRLFVVVALALARGRGRATSVTAVLAAVTGSDYLFAAAALVGIDITTPVVDTLAYVTGVVAGSMAMIAAEEGLEDEPGIGQLAS